MARKRPRIQSGLEPHPGKAPRLSPSTDPKHAYDQSPTWSVSLVDFEGPWGWARLELEDARQLRDRLKNLERMKWREILVNDATGSHRIAVNDLSTGAQRRLKELRLDDFDELLSLRVDGKKRAWGVRDGQVLRFLWWDPDHLVCPSTKRHT